MSGRQQEKTMDATELMELYHALCNELEEASERHRDDEAAGSAEALAAVLKFLTLAQFPIPRHAPLLSLLDALAADRLAVLTLHGGLGEASTKFEKDKGEGGYAALVAVLQYLRVAGFPVRHSMPLQVMLDDLGDVIAGTVSKTPLSKGKGLAVAAAAVTALNKAGVRPVGEAIRQVTRAIGSSKVEEDELKHFRYEIGAGRVRDEVMGAHKWAKKTFDDVLARDSDDPSRRRTILRAVRQLALGI